MITAERYNKLAKKLGFPSFRDSELTESANFEADGSIAKFSIFGVEIDGDGNSALPRLKAVDPTKAPLWLCTNFADVSSGRFIGSAISSSRPWLIRASGVEVGDECGPNSSMAVTTPGNRQFTCIELIENYALVVQNNYVAQVIAEVQGTVNNGQTGTAKIKETEVEFYNWTSRDITGVVRLKKCLDRDYIVAA